MNLDKCFVAKSKSDEDDRYRPPPNSPRNSGFSDSNIRIFDEPLTRSDCLWHLNLDRIVFWMREIARFFVILLMHRNPFVTQMRFDQENYRDRVRDVTFLHFLWRWLNAIYT